MLSDISVDELLDALADQLAQRVAQRLGGSNGRATQRLLDIEAAGLYIGRSKEAIQHMINSGKIPKVQGDRRVQIDIRDLDAWIDSNKQTGINSAKSR